MRFVNHKNNIMKEIGYTEKDVERLNKEKERAYKSSSFQGYDMICLMLEEVIKDVAGR